jgi:hypothetical protein
MKISILLSGLGQKEKSAGFRPCTRNPKIPFLVVFLSFFILLLSPAPSKSGELRPYSLPSQQQPAYRQQYEKYTPDAPLPEFDYAVFETKAANMQPQEREQLRHGLQERLERARKEGENREIGHYARLLDIVDSLP